VNGNVEGNGQGPVYQLRQVEIPTGPIRTAAVVWPPFLQARHGLCTDLDQIELMYESEGDERAANVLCDRPQGRLDWLAAVDAPGLGCHWTWLNTL
jgi:hypothetical protein